MINYSYFEITLTQNFYDLLQKVGFSYPVRASRNRKTQILRAHLLTIPLYTKKGNVMFIIIYEEKKEKKSLLTRLKFNVQELGVTSTHKN